MHKLMIDLETMGNSSTAAIIALGAVFFDEDGNLGNEFYSPIDLQSCLDVGLTIDVSTLNWWMKQSDEARTAAMAGTIELSGVLNTFSAFIRQNTIDTLNVEVWSHATFDVPILGNAYRAVKLPIPWNFRDARDIRTLLALHNSMTRTLEFNFPPRMGVHHHALDDCKYQVSYVAPLLKQFAS